MLDKLTEITNSEDFINRGDLTVSEVITRPNSDEEMKFILEISIDDELTYETKVQKWEIVCKDIIWNPMNSIHELKRPYNQIKVYSDHPLLLNFADTTAVTVSGQCTNISELMGDLFIVHEKVCGHWVDFHRQFFGFPENLRELSKANTDFPNMVCDEYLKVFKKHKLTCTIDDYGKGRDGLKVLLFGNPMVSPDDLNLGQPYLIAKNFVERRIN